MYPAVYTLNSTEVNAGAGELDIEVASPTNLAFFHIVFMPTV